MLYCCHPPQELRLDGNKISDVGLSALADACAKGALASLQTLMLNHNSIGDAGLTAFADAVRSGALASLQTLYVDNNPEHSALKAACEARGIDVA